MMTPLEIFQLASSLVRNAASTTADGISSSSHGDDHSGLAAQPFRLALARTFTLRPCPCGPLRAIGPCMDISEHGVLVTKRYSSEIAEFLRSQLRDDLIDTVRSLR